MLSLREFYLVRFEMEVDKRKSHLNISCNFIIPFMHNQLDNYVQSLQHSKPWHFPGITQQHIVRWEKC